MRASQTNVIDEATSQSNKRANNARQVAGYPAHAGVHPSSVIPANAGIQVVHLIELHASQPYELDSRIRGNDGIASAANHFASLDSRMRGNDGELY
jgi:hypothetical protein